MTMTTKVSKKEIMGKYISDSVDSQRSAAPAHMQSDTNTVQS